MEQQTEMIVDKSGSAETIELVRWCLKHDMLRQAADILLGNIVQMLTGKAHPVLSMQGDAVLGKLERSAVLAAAQSLDAGNLLTAPTELLTWKVGVIQKLMDNAKLREALYSTVLLDPECAMREQADDARLQEELSPVFGEEILSIVDGKEAELREACFLAVDLVRSMFKADGEHKSVWRSAAESKDWVQRHRPEWFCPEASEVSMFESRTPAWMRDGGEREVLMRALPSTADPLLLLADEDLAGVLLFPILTVGENAEAGSLLSMFTDTGVYQLNGRVSVPRFVRVLLDLHFIERLRGTISPTVNTPKSDEAFVEAENKVWRALYTEDKRRGERDWSGVPDFRSDEYKDIVDRAMARLRDLLTQAACTSEKVKPVLDERAIPAPTLVGTLDELTDEDAGIVGAQAKNVLIASLSTLQKVRGSDRLSQSIYAHESYYYQLEPITMKLARDLAARNEQLDEIIMLASEETLRRQVCEWDDGSGRTIRQVCSARQFFMERVRAIPGCENVRFVSKRVDIADPAEVVSLTVERLRALRDANHTAGQEPPCIHLATNGGLRGNQMTLEAILSLLKNEGISVDPHNVWDLKYDNGSHSAEVIPGYKAFKIFDFVSGINEFVQYGRANLLNEFYNPAQEKGKTPELIEKITDIANSIRFNQVGDLTEEIQALREYYRGNTTLPDDSYLSLFHKTIHDSYERMLGDGPFDYVEAIKWCADKELYMQAYTIAETQMPSDYARHGILKCDDRSLRVAYDLFRISNLQEPELLLVNRVISRVINAFSFSADFKFLPKGQSARYRLSKLLSKLRAGEYQVKVDEKGRNATYSLLFCVGIPESCDKLLIRHFRAKDIRNGMCHPTKGNARSGEDDQKQKKAYYDETINAISDYADAVSEIYKSRTQPITVRLIDDGGYLASSSVKSTQPTASGALSRPAAPAAPTPPAVPKVGQTRDGEIICKFTPKELCFEKAVSEQTVNNVKNALANRKLPQWTNALACIEKAKSPEDVKMRINAAMPVLKATALRKIAQLDLIEQDGKQLAEGSREKAYIVKWGKVREYVGDVGKSERDNLTSWLITALCDSNPAAFCGLFDEAQT